MGRESRMGGKSCGVVKDKRVLIRRKERFSSLVRLTMLFVYRDGGSKKDTWNWARGSFKKRGGSIWEWKWCNNEMDQEWIHEGHNCYFMLHVSEMNARKSDWDGYQILGRQWGAVIRLVKGKKCRGRPKRCSWKVGLVSKGGCRG